MGVLGIVLYLVVGWLYLVSGLVVPTPWLFVLWAIWIVGWVLVIRVFRTRPALTAAVPAGAFAFWLLALYLGDAFLGWTA